MVILRKIEVTEEKITYSYDPEKSGKLGIVSYYPKLKKDELVKMSEYESEDYWKYRFHAFSALEKMCIKGEFPDEVMVAWG